MASNNLINERKFNSFPAILFLVLFFSHSFFQDTILNSISQLLISTYQFSPFEISSLSSAFFLSAGVFFLLAGIMLNNHSIKNLVIFASFISLLGAMFFLFTQSFHFLVIARILTGLGYSFSFVCCMRFVSVFYYQHFSLMMGIISALVIFFGMSGQAPFIHLVDDFGLHYAFLVDFILGLIICLGLIAYRKKLDVKPGFKIKNSSSPLGFKGYLKNKNLYLCGFYASLVNAPILFLGSLWGNIYLVQCYHLTRENAGFLLSLMFLGLMLGCPLIGWLSQSQKTRKSIMLLAPALMFFLALLIFFNFELSYWFLTILFITLGFLASAQTLIYPQILHTTTSVNFASIVGMTTFLVMVLSALMQALFGVLLQYCHNEMILLPLSSFIALFVSFSFNTVKMTVGDVLVS